MRSMRLRAALLLGCVGVLVGLSTSRALAQDDAPPAASTGEAAEPPAHPSAEPATEPPPAEHPAEPPAEHPAEHPAGPSTEHHPAGGLDDHPGAPPPEEAAGSSDFTLEDAQKAGYEIGEATNEPANGLGVDGKDYELPASDFEGMPGLDAEDIKALREVTPAEVGDLDMTHDPTPAAMDQLEKQAKALEGLDPASIDKIQALYMPVLRKKLQEVKAKTHDKTVQKMNEKNEVRVGKITTILAWLSLSGFLILLLPLTQGKKYPGQTGKLFGYSALAAGSMVLALLLLTGVLYGMRTAQGATAEKTNPQVVLQDATFDAVDDHLEGIAATPGLLLVPLQQVMSGESDDLGVAILDNAAQFKSDVDVFKSIAKALSSMKEFMGYVPIILTVLAVVLFFVTIKDLIRDVLRAPERAMRGEIRSTEVFTLVMRRVGNEILVTLGTIAVLFVITYVTALALTAVAIPAMSTFIGQLLATLEYVFTQHQASKAYIYIALMGVLLFIGLGVGVIVVSGTLYLGKVQAILRAVLNNKVPMKTFAPFFKWRTLALVWCMALPILTLLGVGAATNMLTKKATTGEYNWSMALLPAPIGLVVGFLLVFVVAYGLKGFLSIARYKVVTQPIGDAAIAQAVQALPAR